MKGGSFFLVTTLLMYPVIKSLSFLLVLRSLNGIAFSLVSTSAITLVVDVTAESRLKAGIGYYAVSGTLASAVGPAVGMLILQKGDFLHLFLANGIMGSYRAQSGSLSQQKAVPFRQAG